MEADSADIMVFFLQSQVVPSILIPLLSRLLGTEIRPLESADAGEGIDYVIEDFKGGFLQCITLYWKRREGYRPAKHDWRVAMELSMATGVPVATFVPPGYPESMIPGHWCLAQPDGSLALTCEDENAQADGLVLTSFRRPFTPGE